MQFIINGEEWTVLRASPNHPKLRRADGSTTVAVCDDDVKTIYVSENVQGAFLRKVLCHEITHAAMFSYNVILSLDQEELIADIIATYGAEIIDITNKLFNQLKGSYY